MLMKMKAIDFAGGKCSICGYNKCPTALEFHHKDKENKSFNVSNLIRTLKNWKKIKLEIKECTLLCENCHRELHAKVN